MQELDPRLIKVGIEVDGHINTYDDLYISAVGTKYANPNQNDAEVKIINLNKETRNFILTETSPFNNNKTPKKLYLDVGRKSYGVFRVFTGNIVTSVPSQPPDIAITLKCLTTNFEKGKIVSKNGNQVDKLSKLSKEVANDLGLSLVFEAQDKQISNYNFTGGALTQVDRLNDMGLVNAYVDDETLVVKDMNLPLADKITIVNEDTGMIGIPETTEQGIKVKFLMDGQTTLGGQLRLTSKIYPAVNGNYIIYKLGFDISNREIPFYWIAEAKRL